MALFPSRGARPTQMGCAQGLHRLEVDACRDEEHLTALLIQFVAGVDVIEEPVSTLTCYCAFCMRSTRLLDACRDEGYAKNSVSMRCKAWSACGDTRKPTDMATARSAASSPTNRQLAAGSAARSRASAKKAGCDLSKPSIELNKQSRRQQGRTTPTRSADHLATPQSRYLCWKSSPAQSQTPDLRSFAAGRGSPGQTDRPPGRKGGHR